MPSYLISLPGSRPPSTGVPLGSKLNYVSESAVHGNTTKPAVAASKPVLSAAQAPVAAHTYVISRAKTH